MKTFAKRSILSLRPLISAKNKHFEKIFGLDGVSNAELKTHFRKIFVMASFSQNLQKSGFLAIFHPKFSYKNNDNFICIELGKFSEKFQIVQLFADILKKV